MRVKKEMRREENVEAKTNLKEGISEKTRLARKRKNVNKRKKKGDKIGENRESIERGNQL